MMKLSLLVMGMLMGVEVFCQQQQQEPPRCCFDREFYATLGEIGGIADEGHNTANIVDANVELAFDFHHSIQGTKANLRNPDGSYNTMYKVLDFQHRREYNWPEKGACTYKTMPVNETMFPPCIPANAIYVGPATFGYGQNTLSVHTWEFVDPVPGLNNEYFRTHLSVTQDHCIPVVETLVGTYMGAPTELSLFYVNYGTGLDGHRNLVTIPNQCTAAPAN